MYPIHDTDAQLLLATLIASKRRPAALAEIVAAAEFMGCPVTAPKAWASAFERFSTHGLLVAEGEDFHYTPLSEHLDEIYSRYVMAEQRDKHHSALHQPSDAGASAGSGPKIELF